MALCQSVSVTSRCFIETTGRISVKHKTESTQRTTTESDKCCQAMATNNMDTKFGEVWTGVFEILEQTKRHSVIETRWLAWSQYLTPHAPRGKLIIFYFRLIEVVILYNCFIAFSPRDAMLARVLAMDLCLSVFVTSRCSVIVKSYLEKDGRSERDKLDHRRLTKLIIPPSSDARPL